MSPSLKIIECPRDAMQGWPEFIPTEDKIRYINTLLDVGFDTIDFGSFVSEKAIPQLKDTRQVLEKLNNSPTKLLAIVANTRGALEASELSRIDYLGFPFSISETFQKRNTNKSIDEAFITVTELQQLCIKSGKELVIYISMGFGNPYGDPYNEEILLYWVDKIAALGVKIISLADTVGLATPDQVGSIFTKLIPAYSYIEFGAHLHARVGEQEDKILSALHAGCYRFDSALKGIGGCPMANDDLVGNIDTEQMLATFNKAGIQLNINKDALSIASQMAGKIFHV